jgi:ABC-type phosphate/phosphonate transport system substrate-binding protein
MGRAYIGILISAVLMGCAGHPAVERPKTVKVAIMPEYSLNRMTERYHLLISYIEEALKPKYKVEWVSCPSHDGFIGTVEGSKPDISMQDAYTSAILSRLQGAIPILQAVAPDGTTMTEGLIVVPEGSGIRDIGELRGKRISIYSRRSFLGFIAQADMLRRAGIDPFRDVKLVRARWQDGVVESVRRGEVDAGFIGKGDLVPGLKAIARTKALPTGYVLIYPHTSNDLARAIRYALAGLDMRDPNHSAVFRAMGIGGFKVVDQGGRESLSLLLKEFSIPY